MNLLKEYGNASGHIVSKEKSTLFVGQSARGRAHQLSNLIDYWLPSLNGSIADYLQISTSRQSELKSFVAAYIHSNIWSIHAALRAYNHQLVEDIEQHPIPLAMNDHSIWNQSPDGVLTLKNAYDFTRQHNCAVNWPKKILTSFISPRRSCVLWRLLYGRMPTDDTLKRSEMLMVSCYSLCRQPSVEESSNHLF
ncbi:Reverse transcriptase zinc-binding domain [Macleaya cordata]|uniref:Reverse transcriptase zinc-binding domain n=1 Tax=Macleaya cordata TaxID=56857 RepID=A0A200QNB7_MACCD|nr:Reverse transcriptase zinc-binding domain [Macleaya cordata]